MQDAVIVFIIFGVAGAVLFAFLLFRHRGRQEVQNTLRKAIEQGRDLTPELVEAINVDAVGGRASDLRKGVIWLALAAGLGIMSWAVDEPEMLGIGGFPLMLGIAYLGLWLFDRGRST